VRVELGQRSYEVTFADDYRGLGAALATLAPSRIAVIADGGAAAHLPAVLAELGDPPVLRVPPGEATKTWAQAGEVLDWLLRLPIDRQAVVLALGGGMVGDLTGFCAAVALRGARWALAPTTLLAMVDSAVGGKTAVDHSAGKNLIGAFHQPSLVWAAACALDTLPAAEVCSGLGEVVKTGLLAGDPLWSSVRAWGGDRAGLLALAEACAAFKARVVAEDEHDRGRRMQLNLGHTLGHAWEAASGYQLRHGEAVAIGLVAEARIAVSLGLAPADLPAEIAGVLAAVGLPVEPPPFPDSAVLAALALDKKAAGDILVIPLLRAIGAVSLVRLRPEEALKRSKVSP
jgi:3-dehydroquinate synthase